MPMEDLSFYSHWSSYHIHCFKISICVVCQHLFLNISLNKRHSLNFISTHSHLISFSQKKILKNGKVTSLYGKTKSPSCSEIFLMSFCSWLTYWVSAHKTPMSCCLTPAAALRRLTSLSNCFILKMMIFWIFLRCRVILLSVFSISAAKRKKFYEVLKICGVWMDIELWFALVSSYSYLYQISSTADATHVSFVYIEIKFKVETKTFDGSEHTSNLVYFFHQWNFLL